MSFKNLMPLTLIIMISFSCSWDKQSVNQEIDTIKNKVSITVKEIISEDTLFKNVVMTEISVSDKVSKNLHDKLGDIFDHYLAIKDELAENDSVDSRKHANKLLDVVIKSSDDLNNKTDKNLKILGDNFMQYRKVIEKSKTLEGQRQWFSKLTASLTEAIQQYGIPNKTVYELNSLNSFSDNNNKWLTDSRDSDDPYIGGREYKQFREYKRDRDYNSNREYKDGDREYKGVKHLDNRVVVLRGWEFN